MRDARKALESSGFNKRMWNGEFTSEQAFAGEWSSVVLPVAEAHGAEIGASIFQFDGRDAEASAIFGEVQAQSGATARGRRPGSVGRSAGVGIPRNRLYAVAQDLENKGEQAFGGSWPAEGGRRRATLKRETARLKEENEILKKAAAYFARELP